MNRIFFLGGHDLEMQTIRELLEHQKETYIDKQLRWDNAYLKCYEDELKQYANQDTYQLYGIELNDPDHIAEEYQNYHLIDHHTMYNDRPSCLIQIAYLLDIPLTRYQQLVAANDCGYIPAMQQIGATSIEIADIRQKDRKAQGVTLQDEELAIKAIKENKQTFGDLILIKALSPKFSPICDRLYPVKNLLIYTEDELMYYGERKDQLVQLFKKEITEGKFFYGGGTDGYIGIPRYTYLESDIMTICDTIKQNITN